MLFGHSFCMEEVDSNGVTANTPRYTNFIYRTMCRSVFHDLHLRCNRLRRSSALRYEDQSLFAFVVGYLATYLPLQCTVEIAKARNPVKMHVARCEHLFLRAIAVRWRQRRINLICSFGIFHVLPSQIVAWLDRNLMLCVRKAGCGS